MLCAYFRPRRAQSQHASYVKHSAYMCTYQLWDSCRNVVAPSRYLLGPELKIQTKATQLSSRSNSSSKQLQHLRKNLRVTANRSA